MSDNNLQDLLKELHRELDNQTIPPEDQSRLRQLAQGLSVPAHPSTIDQFQDAATRFEVSHPELTGVLERVITTLNNMGI